MKLAFTERHFGNAERFAIAELSETDYSWVYEDERVYSPPHGIDKHDSLREKAALLSGVNVLFTGKAGAFAYNLLSNAGIQVLEQTGDIEYLIDGYVKYLKRPRFAGLK
ncbi:hypothetical protein FACS1894202_10200 [Clostridia bacterium]|nr:hypothetical protein FACS1894202_10200 [Clostridia bacterium]